MKYLFLAVALLGCSDPLEVKKVQAEQAHLRDLARCVCANKGGVQLTMYDDFGALRFVCRNEQHTRFVTPSMTCYDN